MRVLWDVLIALLTATLSGMGVGGGGFLMIYLTLYRRFPTALAQGVNLLCFLCACGVSLLTPPPREDFSLGRKTAIGMAITGFMGAALGSHCSAGLPRETFRWVFGLFLCASGGYALFTSFRTPPQSPH